MALHRTPLTWALYGTSAAFASFIYLTGPIAPILAEDLGVAVGAAGLVGTALAAGIATASVTGPAAIARLGRDRTIRIGLVVALLGLALTALAPTVIRGTAGFGVVLVLIWVVASGGGTVLNASTARLSEIHPEDSAQAITEGQAAAGWVGVFSPLLLGAALSAGMGWWVGVAACMLAIVAALGGLLLADRVERASAMVGDRHGADPGAMIVADEAYEAPPAAARGTDRDGGPDPGVRGRLPRIFWLAMIALFAAVSTEFAITFWGSTLIREQTGVSAGTATAAVSVVVAGIAIGRTVGSWLTARLGPHRMLLGGFGLALVGFGILWSATVLAVAVVGLLVAGLGLATLFPLILDRGIQLSDGHPDIAMSRSSLVLGLAVGGAPFLLGALGSVASVKTALMLVPILVVGGLVGVVVSRPGDRTTA
jgi:fucose permease